MGVMTTGSNPALMWPGVKAATEGQYKRWPTTWSKIYEKVSSDKAYEEYVGLTGFGLAQIKDQGRATYIDSSQQGYTARLTNVAWSLGYTVTHENIVDNQYPALAKRYSSDLVRSFAETKEINGANPLNRAFNASYTGADGVSLCNTAHPNIHGGTWANKPAVDADLSEAALEDAIIALRGFTDDRGNRINVGAAKLIVARQEEFNAYRILNSIKQPGTANNDPNAVMDSGNLPGGMVVNVWLDSPHAWFIKTDMVNDGLIYQEREGFRFSQDNDASTMNFSAFGYERYVFGFNNPRAIYGVNGP